MGQACGRHRVARLMREAGLRVRSRKRWLLLVCFLQQHLQEANCIFEVLSAHQVGRRGPAAH
ncbi:transposase [Pseudomonas sp. JM0905a]|nr:transposase [Pseudomonas sp. JM0905a]